MKMVDPNEEVEMKVESPKPESKIEFWPIEDLPSKYLLYPEGTKIYGRPLKVIEVKKLALMNENNFEFVINEVLKNALKGIEIDDLLTADKLYIIFFLRANTYREPGYSIELKCPECNQDSSYDFSLNNLEISYMKEDYFKSKTFELKNKDKLTFGYLTIREENYKNKFKKTHENNLVKFEDDMLELASRIKEVNGTEMLLEEKYNYLTNLDAQNYVYMESYLKRFDIGIKPVLNVKCNKCGGMSQVGVTFRSEFFIPEYKF